MSLLRISLAPSMMVLLMMVLLMMVFLTNVTSAAEPTNDYPISPVPFTKVSVAPGFWLKRMETNRKVTIKYDFERCEQTGRIDNFSIAAGRKEGKHQGFWFNDSDVFKVIEGAAYSLALHPDPKLDKYLDDLIEKIAASQEDDGYLYTIRTIHGDKDFRLQRYAGKKRWSYLEHSHELYNVGHMYEAAVAHYEATGKRTLLNVAIKNANLVDSIFGPDKTIQVSGHQEIEIGLARLYRVTGDERYLKLAKFFLDYRGRKDKRELFGEYSQDHLPVIEQKEAVGHAVRAVYMYSGMADVAALTGDKSYIKAIDDLWDNVVTKKMHLTGGLGARHANEAFGENYELPNDTAYNETCAAIGGAMWNHRMFLLHGDGKYIDVLERTIYNGFLAGIAIEGNKFFYPNPLSCNTKLKFNKGAKTRSPWFDCSCCPVNIVRFIPAIAGYIYASNDEAVYVNLFVPGEGQLEHRGSKIQLSQETRYPWNGKVAVTVNPEKPGPMTLRVRVPGWAQGRPVPGDLYRYEGKADESISLQVNGEDFPLQVEKGFAQIDRTWKQGDVVTLNLAMPIRRVVTNDKVEANRGRVALERGPLVYCLEGADNNGQVLNLALSGDAKIQAEESKELFGGITILRGTATASSKEGDDVRTKPVEFTAIPYYAWSHRDVGEMAVWIPTDVKLTTPVAAKAQPK